MESSAKLSVRINLTLIGFWGGSVCNIEWANVVSVHMPYTYLWHTSQEQY